jgi:hypothetical protein
LPDGTEVEVRLGRESDLDTRGTPAHEDVSEQQREEAFLESLLQSGRITSIPTRRPPPGWEDWKPIESSGPPLSEQIIEERR